MAGIAWVNGELLQPEQPAISPLDRGFLYGEGLFETMRAYRGRVFRLDQHLDRLAAGAAEIGLRLPDRATLVRAVHEAVAAGRLAEAAVRLTVTPGLSGLASDPTTVVLVRPLSAPPMERYTGGCRAASVPAAHVGSTPLRRIKSLNYLDKLLAQRAAARKGADEAILVDPDGSVVEGAMRNVFAATGRELVTPPISRCFLAGITRAAVLEVGKRFRLTVHERDISLEELRAMDECFLTSSLAEILPVASIDGHPLGVRAPGPLTCLVAAGYRSLVNEELEAAGEPSRSG
jgi:branched-chain amino acid aminotransferase